MKFGELTKRKLEIIQKLKYKESKHPRKPGILCCSVRINRGKGNIIPCLIYIMPDTLEYAKNIDMTVYCQHCRHSAKTCKCDYPYYGEPHAISNRKLRIEEREMTSKKSGKFIEVQVLMFAGNYENSFYEQWREDEPEKAKAADIRWEKEEEERIRAENNYSDPWDSIGPDEGWSREGRPD